MNMTELALRAPIDKLIQYIFYGFDLLARDTCPAPPPVMSSDLANNRASQPQYCYLLYLLRVPTSPMSVPPNHSIAGFAKFQLRPAT